MRRLLLFLPLGFVMAGCDAIYERPAPEVAIDFGAPYSVQSAGFASIPPGARSAPYVTLDNHLVADIAYPVDCKGSFFTTAFKPRDERTADVWLVHHAESGSCGADALREERLTVPLPHRVEKVPRLILLTPDEGALQVDRD